MSIMYEYSNPGNGIKGYLFIPLIVIKAGNGYKYLIGIFWILIPDMLKNSIFLIRSNRE